MCYNNKNYLYEYLLQFTLDKLLERKWNSTPEEWKRWIRSLNEYEINCIASTLSFDEVVRERYDSIRLSKLSEWNKNLM